MDAPIENWFRLSPARTTAGVSCGKDGVFVGGVPLLERVSGPSGGKQWRPRAIPELDSELSKRFALRVECARKMPSLAAVACALDRGDIALAQIATLHLQIPDPPNLAKSAPSASETVNLARRLHRGGLLKSGWDPAKHPRWPAGSTGGIGGEFSPVESDTDASAPDDFDDDSGEGEATVIPAQVTIPAPLEMPFPGEMPIPRPFEYVPPPLDIPNTQQRDGIPQNPYPDRPECVEEWEAARKYCERLRDRRLLGEGDYREMGKLLWQCIMGQISEACGGNSAGA